MTRHEHDKLLEVLERLAHNHRQEQRTILTLQDILRDVEQQLQAEDDANTSQANREVKSDGERSV